MAGQAIHNITNADIAYAQAGIVTDVRMEMRERERERGGGKREREIWLVSSWIFTSLNRIRPPQDEDKDRRTNGQTDRQTDYTDMQAYDLQEGIFDVVHPRFVDGVLEAMNNDSGPQ